MTTKQFDPSWPFPQFSEEGVQLLPADWDPKPAVYDPFAEAEEALW